MNVIGSDENESLEMWCKSWDNTKLYLSNEVQDTADNAYGQGIATSAGGSAYWLSSFDGSFDYRGMIDMNTVFMPHLISMKVKGNNCNNLQRKSSPTGVEGNDLAKAAQDIRAAVSRISLGYSTDGNVFIAYHSSNYVY